MGSQLGHKWEGKVCARVTKASADQIWPLCTDFFNLHKWFPGLSDCHGIQGENGEPGCMRYCSGFSLSSEGAGEVGENRPISWAKERLVSIDHVGRSLSYDMLDSNIGFNSYLGTIRVVSNDGDGDGGCTIEWSFSVDPVEGWVREDLVREVYEAGLQGMAKKMEDSFAN
ncbi:lachrymatory-factor synthase-like [Rhodamnia argentea]|uniref:Lachrymatory-factor synthase-like n=1 Tax=Rhodamnia argentea TaxID=178133 RepID=A0A8B8MS93_9MYRT|nr:lachrymatory-factor synthase-like [Rhodamnia argentea]